MELISPISAQSCSPYIGKQVCAVMQDGTEIFGYLSRVDGQKLYLSMVPGGQGAVSAKPGKSKKPVKAQNQKNDTAQTSFYNPYFFPGEIALELALITLLFAVPFFYF